MTSRLSSIVVCVGLVIAACGADRSPPAVVKKQAAPVPEARPPSRESLEASPSYPHQEGAALYQRMCVVCHGAHGEGYKADRAPAIGGQDFLASVTDDFLRRAIVSGRLGTTMSAWSKDLGGPLAASDVDALIAFLRSWSNEPKATLDERPISGNLVRGATLFARECQSCHGVRGMLGPALRIGNRQLLIAASDGFLRYAIRKGRPNTEMQGFEAKLGDRGIEDVVTYLRHLQDEAPLAAVPQRPPPPLPLGPVPLHPHGPEPRGFQVYPGVTSVDVVHAQMVRGARMALLDARTPSDYANEHIAFAVSVPFYDPAPYLHALPKDAWLVCYCACPHAESSELAEKLMAAGFQKVTVLREGLSSWVTKKFPTRAGEKP